MCQTGRKRLQEATFRQSTRIVTGAYVARRPQQPIQNFPDQSSSESMGALFALSEYRPGGLRPPLEPTRERDSRMRRAPIVAFSGLLFLLPMAAAGQDAPTMVVRVHEDGNPTADVPIQEFVDGNLRVLAVTASSGLAVVDAARSRLDIGSWTSAFVVTCDGATVVLIVPEGGNLPASTDQCARTSLGRLNWGAEERLVVALGQNPAMDVMAAEVQRTSGQGVRFQVGPVLSVPGGSELDGLNSGIGGEVQLGSDWTSGFGLGGGVGVTTHDLEGADESLTHWNLFAEPRFTFHADRPGARPYVAGRISYSVLDAGSGAGLLTEKGWGFGGGAGIAVPIAGSLMLDLWTRVLAVSFDAEGLSRSGADWRSGASLRF